MHAAGDKVGLIRKLEFSRRLWSEVLMMMIEEHRFNTTRLSRSQGELKNLKFDAFFFILFCTKFARLFSF